MLKNTLKIIIEKKQVLPSQIFEAFLNRNINRLTRNIEERRKQINDLTSAYDSFFEETPEGVFNEWNDLCDSNFNDERKLIIFLAARG